MSVSSRTLTRRPVERTPANDGYVQALWAEKLLLDEQITALTQRRSDIHEELHDYARSHGTRDSKGSFRVRLENPAKTLKKTSPGFRRQCSTTTSLDVDYGLALADRKGFRHLVEKTQEVTVVDPDGFWAAYQEGYISRAEIDALMIREHSYSIRSL